MKKPSFSGLLSPTSFLVVAALLTSAYAALHVAGWREQVSILSGTLSPTASSAEMQLAQALVYAGLYFSVVLLVPVLVMAGMLQLACRRVVRRKPAPITAKTARSVENENDQTEEA